MRPDFNAPKSDWIEYAKELELLAGLRRDDEIERQALKLRTFYHSLGVVKQTRAIQTARLVLMLVRHPNGLRRETIANQLLSECAHQGKYLDVMVCDARKQFRKAWGFNSIITLRGFGFQIVPEAIEIIKNVIEGEENG